MLFYGLSAFSPQSAGAAIAAAIGRASADFGEETHSVHIIVTNVFEVENGWMAIVRVVIEPDLDRAEEDGKEPAHDKEKTKSFEKDKERDRENQGDLDDESIEKLRDLIDHSHTFVFMPEKFEDVHSQVQDILPDLNIRVIEEGPLWDAVQTEFLDNEFYEAAHLSEMERRYGSGGGLSQQKVCDDYEKKPPQSQQRSLTLKQQSLLQELTYDFK